MVFDATFNSISVTSISWWLYILYTLLFYNIFFYEILVPVCHVHFEEVNEYDVYYYNWTSNRHICSNIPPNQLKCGSEYTTISVDMCTVLSRNSLLLRTHNQASEQVNGTESIHCGSEHHQIVDRQSVFWVHTKKCCSEHIIRSIFSSLVLSQYHFCFEYIFGSIIRAWVLYQYYSSSEHITYLADMLSGLYR